MFTARVASEPGGTKCATARNSWCAAPNFFTFTPPQAPCRPGYGGRRRFPRGLWRDGGGSRVARPSDFSPR
eukprot:6734281-Prymnesium_polylepis.2